MSVKDSRMSLISVVKMELRASIYQEATLVHVHLVSMEFIVEIKATLAAVELLLKCVAMERVWTRHRRLDQLLTRVFVMRVGRLLELDQCVIRISTNVQVQTHLVPRTH